MPSILPENFIMKMAIYSIIKKGAYPIRDMRKVYKGEIEEKYSATSATEQGELCIFLS